MNHLSDRLPENRWFLALVVAVCWSAPIAADEPTQKAGHVDIDGVNFPFGQIVEVVGPCLTTDSDMLGFSYASASLLGLRIDGWANQENIAFHLLAESDEDRKKLDSLKKDAYYKVRGRLTGARMSGPKRACNLEVEHIDAVPSASLMPKDFLGRMASFEGVAQPNGTLTVNGETLHLVKVPTWPKDVVGKTVHVSGSVGQGPQGWQLSMPTWNLANLSDRVGQDVSLDGVLFSLNDHWWFDYRDERLYLTSDAGPQLSFSGEHGRLATVTGKLVRQLRPSLKQITEKSDRDLVLTYVVRGAKVTFRDDSKTWYERFGFIYSGQNKVSDGVPELLAELSYRKNLLGYETDTMLFTERNAKTISSIIQSSTQAVRDVLARRMNDVLVNRSLRLLYAAILARVNDERGREFLKNLAESPGDVPQKEIYFCLGVFPFLGSDVDKKINTDCKWAEQTLIAIMSSPKSNAVAFRYSSIPHVLIKINTPAARKVLLGYALQTESKSEFFFRSSVVPLLCAPSVQLPAENLLQLEAVAKKNGSSRRAILRALLRLKDPAVTERFLGDFENGFVYMDFRDLSSPEVLASLSPLLPKLTGESKSNVQMLLVLGEKDPVPALIALLNDRKYPDKNLVLFELARIADDRAIKPVARILREADKDYFKIDFTLVIKGIAPKQTSESFSAPILTNANASYTGIRHALEALAKTHKRSAVQELIDLLGVDLGRFGGDTDKAGFQRIIAAHLIEMTGESFGVDQIGWRKWERAQPDERFRALESKQGKNGTYRLGPNQSIDLGN
ncbi:hypothetical protein [uncultured Gimesia sp.]|uniref:HEAT repeat domain-containing protein n=1 Tax=uncultured Gimesia sp. TaxID=1678688 RepID=UPI0026386B32|nr:hypothetical protein [uncultured Gimesia sp.]